MIFSYSFFIVLPIFFTWFSQISGQNISCWTTCATAYPNPYGFQCPPGLDGTWEPIEIDCKNGGTLGCEYTVQYFNGQNQSIWAILCNCPSGWSGKTCEMCTNDSVCTGNSTSVVPCDRTPNPLRYKRLECYPTDPFVISLFGEGTVQYDYSVADSTAYVTIWSRRIGQPPFAFCNLTGCTVDGANDMVNFRCSAIGCTCNNDPRVGNNCSNLIGYFLLEVLRTTSVLSCTPTVNPQCTLKQNELPVDVVMSCTASECGLPPPLPAIDPLAQARGIILGIIFIPIAISLCILLPLFIYYLQTKRQGKAWTEDDINKRISGCRVELKNIKYSLRPKSGGFSCKKRPRRIKILRNVSLVVQPGEICAVMGSSGAGKTTLLDILANYQKVGRLRGEILIDGKPIPRSYKRIIGYVNQDEALMGTLTVEEQLTYSAQLRLPGSVPYSRIKEIVSNVIKDLRLEHVRNTLIGTSEKRGLSGGERRRVAIATELVTSPKILLLDEPTSGLDSYNALIVMQLLQDLAQRNCTIICSIHQPRSEIFKMFNQLVLLWKGSVVYSGERKYVTKFFAEFGFKCPKYENPADYIIHIINTQPDDKVKELVDGFPQWKEQFFKNKTPQDDESDNPDKESSKKKKKKNKNKNKKHTEVQKQENEENEGKETVNTGEEVQVEMLEDLQSDNKEENKTTEDSKSHNKKTKSKEMKKYSSPWGKQLLVLSHRAAVHLWRDPILLKTHGAITILVALFMGLTFLKIGNDISGIQNRVGLLFFIEILFSFACLSAVDLFLGDRVIFKKERSNGCYYVSAYYLSKVLSDLIPLRIIMPLVFGTIVYWMAGLRPDAGNFMRFLIVFLLVNLTAASLVYVISVSVPSVTVGNITTASLFLFLFLFGGFLVNFDSIPPYLGWIRYISFFSYGFESLAVNELQDLPLTLSAEGFPSINIKGDVFLQAFALHPENYWPNVGVLAGMVVGYLIIAYIVLRFARKPKQ